MDPAAAGFAGIAGDERIVERTRTEPGVFVCARHAPAGRMPLSVVPTRENDPSGTPQASGPGPEQTPRPEQAPGPEQTPGTEPTASSAQDRPVVHGTSRWIDYDTHELLEMISELEDERRWARLREGVLWAILVHILLLSSITWIPRYVFRVPPVIDPFDAIKERKDLKYLDLPPDLISKYQPKVAVKPVEPKKAPQRIRRRVSSFVRCAK